MGPLVVDSLDIVLEEGRAGNDSGSEGIVSRIDSVSIVLSVTSLSATQWLGSLRRLRTEGFTNLQCRIGPEGLVVTGGITGGSECADFVIYSVLESDNDGRVHLALSEVQLYGLFPLPAPLVAARFLTALGVSVAPAEQKARDLATLQGCTEADLDVLRIVLQYYVEDDEISHEDLTAACTLALAQDSLQLAFQNAPGATDHPDESNGHTKYSALNELDRQLLIIGDIEHTVTRYQHLMPSWPKYAPLTERLLQLLVSLPHRDESTLALARRAQLQPDTFVCGLLSEAVVHLRAGELTAAQRCFLSVADNGKERGRQEQELTARVAACHHMSPDNREQALQHARHVIEAEPNHHGALRELARLYADQGRWVELKTIRRKQCALTSDPQDRARNLLALAELCRSHMANPTEARTYYEAALRIDPTCEPALRGLSEACIETDDIEGAVAALDQLRQIAEQRTDAEQAVALRLRLASLWEHAGFTDRATRELEQCRAISPKDPTVLQRLAHFLAASGRVQEAVEALRELLRTISDQQAQASIHRDLAELYLGPLNNVHQAEVHLEFARSLGGQTRTDTSPDHEPVAGQPTAAAGTPTPAPSVALSGTQSGETAWAEVAEALRRRCLSVQDPALGADQRLRLATVLEDKLDRPYEALAVYEEAAVLAPNNPEVIAACADASYRQQEWEHAKRHYHRLVDLGSSLPGEELWYRQGVIHEALAEVEEAAQCYDRATAIGPEHRAALEGQARLAERQGSGMVAISALTRLDRLLSVDEIAQLIEVRERLGELHLRHGNLTKARSYLNSTLGLDPRRRKSIQLLISVHERLGEFRDMAGLLERLIHLTDDSLKRASLLHRRAEILAWRLGDEQQAIDCLLKAYDIAPSHTPTLWRLVDYYWSQGDMQAVVEIGDDLEKAGARQNTEPDLRHVRIAVATLLARKDEQRAVELLSRALAERDLAVPAVMDLAHAVNFSPQTPAPSADPVPRALAKLLRDSDQRSRSWGNMRALLDRCPRVPGLDMLIGEIAALDGDSPSR